MIGELGLWKFRHFDNQDIMMRTNRARRQRNRWASGKWRTKQRGKNGVFCIYFVLSTQWHKPGLRYFTIRTAKMRRTHTERHTHTVCMHYCKMTIIAAATTANRIMVIKVFKYLHTSWIICIFLALLCCPRIAFNSCEFFFAVVLLLLLHLQCMQSACLNEAFTLYFFANK